MPYCRHCGTKLDEDARFCHKCGTPVTFIPQAAPVRPIMKDPLVIAAIVLVVILVVAAIVTAIVFAPLYPVEFNQANEVNQPNINQLNFNLDADTAQINIIAQNLTDKTILMTVSATGSRGIFGSTDPIEVTFSNQTINDELTVTSKIKTGERGAFARNLNVVCNVYINPKLTLNLNVKSQYSQISLSADGETTIQTLNLEAITGEVQVNLNAGTTINGDLSLKSQTGSMWLRLNQAKIQDNVTFSLLTTTGSINMDITQTRTLDGTVQVNAETTTGSINLKLLIDGEVGARIESRTNLGSITTDVKGFSGNQSPIQSNNYPAESNILINNLVNSMGSIHLNAAYQSSSIPIVRN